MIIEIIFFTGIIFLSIIILGMMYVALESFFALIFNPKNFPLKPYQIRYKNIWEDNENETNNKSRNNAL